MKKRVRWLDVAKGIGIICIILGHLESQRINRIVFTFHVPLFFVIAGYFYNGGTGIKEFACKKAKALLLPYTVTCITVCLSSFVINLIRKTDWKEPLSEWFFASVYGAGSTFMKPLFIPQIGAIWFLLALFWGLLFLKLIEKMKGGMRVCIVLLVLAIAVWSAQYIWLPFSIQAGGCALFYLYLGYMCKKFQSQIIRFLEASPEMNFVLFLFIAVNWVGTIRNFKGLYLVRAMFANGIYDLCGSLCGIIVVLVFSKILSARSEILSNALAFAGSHSLLILCVHVLELNLVPWKKMYVLLQGYLPLADRNYFAVLIVGKLIFISGLVAVMLSMPCVRRIFGYRNREIGEKK